MQNRFRCLRRYARLYVYASLASDVDTRVAKYQAMQQEMARMDSAAAALRR